MTAQELSPTSGSISFRSNLYLSVNGEFLRNTRSHAKIADFLRLLIYSTTQNSVFLRLRRRSFDKRDNYDEFMKKIQKCKI